MKNLFVLHTQYNLILGTGIILNKFRECQNDLVVYAEFTLSPEFKQVLNSIFSNVLYVREKYEKIGRGFLSIEKELYSDFLQFNKSRMSRESYDNIFISQDRPFESLIVGICKKNNIFCKFWNIEEDCYYSIRAEQNSIDYKLGWHTRRSWLLRKIIYGTTYQSDERSGNYIYGQSSYFDGIYALFPSCIRPQLSNIMAVEITQKEILSGIAALYQMNRTVVNNADKYVLFFFDLLERYKSSTIIQSLVMKLAKTKSGAHEVFLLKYHPRETNKYILNDNYNITEVPSIIPAEKVLCDLYGKDVTVYGSATTAIIVAAKLGFKTVSVAGIENPDNKYMIEQFKKMGIIVPASDKDLIETIQ